MGVARVLLLGRKRSEGEEVTESRERRRRGFSMRLSRRNRHRAEEGKEARAADGSTLDPNSFTSSSWGLDESSRGSRQHAWVLASVTAAAAIGLMLIHPSRYLRPQSVTAMTSVAHHDDSAKTSIHHARHAEGPDSAAGLPAGDPAVGGSAKSASKGDAVANAGPNPATEASSLSSSTSPDAQTKHEHHHKSPAASDGLPTANSGSELIVANEHQTARPTGDATSFGDTKTPSATSGSGGDFDTKTPTSTGPSLGPPAQTAEIPPANSANSSFANSSSSSTSSGNAATGSDKLGANDLFGQPQLPDDHTPPGESAHSGHKRKHGEKSKPAQGDSPGSGSAGSSPNDWQQSEPGSTPDHSPSTADHGGPTIGAQAAPTLAVPEKTPPPDSAHDKPPADKASQDALATDKPLPEKPALNESPSEKPQHDKSHKHRSPKDAPPIDLSLPDRPAPENALPEKSSSDALPAEKLPSDKPAVPICIRSRVRRTTSIIHRVVRHQILH